jgi:hypothetical protein
MRRPGIRSLAGGAAGIVAGVIGGIALSSVSAASGPMPAAPGLDAVHVPPVLTRPGEPVTLRYAIVCAPSDDGAPCDGAGSVYIRAGQNGGFQQLTLERGEDSSDGRYFVDLPHEIASSRAGFSYYATLRDRSSGSTITVPAGGAAAPQRSVPLRDAAEIALGVHVFGRDRAPDAQVVAAAWGSDVGEAGLAGSRELGFVGPSSFDVAADGTVAVLDQVNGRVERWTRAGVKAASAPRPSCGASAVTERRAGRSVSPTGHGPSSWQDRRGRLCNSSRRSNGCPSPSAAPSLTGRRKPDTVAPAGRSPVVARWWSNESVSVSSGWRSSRAMQRCAAGGSRARRPSAKCSSPSRMEITSSSS